MKQKIRKNVKFIQWKSTDNPPDIDESGFIFITNIWPGNDDVSWWLNQISQNFVAGRLLSFSVAKKFN